MFEIFGPIFEQNASINFKPIFEKSVNFGPIFEKSVNFEHFVNVRWTQYYVRTVTKYSKVCASFFAKAAKIRESAVVQSLNGKSPLTSGVPFFSYTTNGEFLDIKK